MSTINPSPDNNPWSAQIINTPQPIKIAIEGDFITLMKQDVPICKFNTEDIEALNTAITLLNGILRVGAVYGEIENIRDILKEVRES